MNTTSTKTDARQSEAELIQRIRGGDEQAFLQLTQAYSERLYRKAVSMVTHPEDAQDILQEAYLSAFRAFPRFRADSGVYTWLYRIVVNKAKDHLSRKRGSRENLIDHQEVHFEDSRVNYERDVESGEDADYLFDRIHQLDPIYRDILLKRYYEEMSYQDIGELMGINIGTVKSRLFKAKEILKKNIARDGRGGDFFAV